MWDAADMTRIFDNNRAWRKKMMDEDPEYFKKQAEGQEPEYLLIGCSDSRVGAQEIMGMHQGEIFIHRNIANVFVPTDLNLLSVLFYAVNVLKVKDIIVLGHYECGGVKAASQNQDLGLIEHWLQNIRNVQRLHKDELAQISDEDERHRRLVELNVQEQCFNLYCNSIVQQMQAKTGRPRVHGMVYDIADGRLKYLDIDFKAEIRKYRDIYTVADFRSHTPVSIHSIGTKTQEEREAEKKEHARHLFDAMDTDSSGNLGPEEITEAMNRFTGSDLSEEEIAEAMRPLSGINRGSYDLNAFEEVLAQLQSFQTSDTDRLVVVSPSGGGKPPRPIQCNGTTTILELKQAINSLVGIPVEQQSLYFQGIQLKDDRASLIEAGINEIAEVELREEITPARFKGST